MERKVCTTSATSISTYVGLDSTLAFGQSGRETELFLHHGDRQRYNNSIEKDSDAMSHYRFWDVGQLVVAPIQSCVFSVVLRESWAGVGDSASLSEARCASSFLSSIVTVKKEEERAVSKVGKELPKRFSKREDTSR